jgi:sugar O-acyltransferase (sialic acid O-acetyltransferase NeuD family)
LKARVVVFGAGGHSRVVADVVCAAGFELVGHLDEVKPEGEAVGARSVLGGALWLAANRGVLVALGIGSNAIRREVFELSRSANAALPAFVHPSAVVSPSAQLAEGVVVMPGAIINAGASIGVGAIINSGAVVEHDCVVGEFAHVSPNATMAGAAKLLANAHLGAAAAVLPGVEVGEGTDVGAGAVVVKALRARVVAAGVPARVLREKS